MRHSVTLLLALFITFAAGCNSFSKYSIDEQPTVKIDTSLCGVWKLVKDSSSKRFIVIQYSGQHIARLQSVTDSDRNATSEEFGWEFEKTIERNRKIELAHLTRFGAYEYMIACSNEKGNDIAYSRFTFTLSSIGKYQFINIPCHDVVYDSTDVHLASLKHIAIFYSFAKLLYLNKTNDTFAIAMVKSPQLPYTESNAEVRKLITANIENSSFYSDTLHFYRVSDYHDDIHEAYKYVNTK